MELRYEKCKGILYVWDLCWSYYENDDDEEKPVEWKLVAVLHKLVFDDVMASGTLY
jgi:hypothetical protein